MRRHALICLAGVCIVFLRLICLAGVCIVFLSACSGPQVLTAMDQQAILTALAAYEESKGVEPVLAWHIRPKIRAEKGQAWAQYSKSRPTEQIVFVPIVVELRKSEGAWAVVSEKSDWPWWWRVANRTIGVK